MQVTHPKNHQESSRLHVGPAAVSSCDSGSSQTWTKEHPADIKERSDAKAEVAPLVASPNERTDESADDHDEVKEDGDEKVRKRQRGDQEERGEQKRRRDNPVDVSHVPDATGWTASDAASRVSPASVYEFDRDRGTSEIGGQSEVLLNRMSFISSIVLA